MPTRLPGHPGPMTDAPRPHGGPHGVDPRELSDDDVVREVTHLHETRHEAMRGASESAFEAHTERMLALEQEYMRRFPEDSAPDPLRTRAGAREDAGQPVPGRDLDGAPY
jgi:Family of unknown function (DUF6158)